MDIRLIVVGRLKSEPEALLVADYLDRAVKEGRKLGFQRFDIHEIDERKAKHQIAQAEVMRTLLTNEEYWVLDEHGQNLSSPEFANCLGRHRDAALGRLNLVIGGADGIDHSVLKEARQSISFGKMVWPHMLARVMLAEQLYRAMTILAGGPYHRF